MVKVNEGERRRVFEIQIESHRAGGQSIVGSAGNMNLLEATLDQLARAHQACIHQLLHPNIFDSAHSYIQLTFLLDQFFGPRPFMVLIQIFCQLKAQQLNRACRCFLGVVNNW